MNQTTMMHQISKYLNGYEHCFTPFYGDGLIKLMTKLRMLDFSILGGQFRQKTEEYLRENDLKIDYRGENNAYHLIFTCSDLIVPKNIKGEKLILVQEGMIDPETITYKLIRYLKLPRFLASTAMTGLSDAYDYFCIASEGFKELFIKKGIKPEKMVVTGIPNFDNLKHYVHNDFPHRNFMLVATSDMRETFKYENRKKLINRALKIADGRLLIFKLHPNENIQRATKEINTLAPKALVFSNANIYHMVANCNVLLTRYSSVALMAVILGKEVHSDISTSELRKLAPVQNGGISALSIAELGKRLLTDKLKENQIKLL
ncbi:MAG: hypothetical protein Q8933_03935 [Bacteroidota bacterium]|nr:hypothetical protein [Bacteroidota bacterium]